jgi:hypothetical protein
VNIVNILYMHFGLLGVALGLSKLFPGYAMMITSLVEYRNVMPIDESIRVMRTMLYLTEIAVLIVLAPYIWLRGIFLVDEQEVRSYPWVKIIFMDIFVCGVWYLLFVLTIQLPFWLSHSIFYWAGITSFGFLTQILVQVHVYKFKPAKI